MADDPNKKLRVRFGADIHSLRDLCANCGVEVDPDLCHCGLPRADHAELGPDHPFVPLGCNCHRQPGRGHFLLPDGTPVQLKEYGDVREVIEPGDAFTCRDLRPKSLGALFINGFALPYGSKAPPKRASIVLEVSGKVALDMSVRAAIAGALSIPIHVPERALIKVVQLDVPELVVFMCGERSIA